MITWTDPAEVPAGTIVVGWDGWRHSSRALAWAVENARGKRPITVVHAVAPRLAGDLALWADDSELRRAGSSLVAPARMYLDEHTPHIETNVLVVLEDPRDALVRLSRRAAVVVVGSHGRGPVSSKLLGSVGLGVARHARCPVVVVRSHQPATVRRGVLAAVDLDEGATGVARFAFHEASLLALPLTIIHTVPEDGSEVLVANAQRQLSELLAGLRETYPDVYCATEVVTGRPEDVVVERSQGRHLAVIGAPRRPRGVLSSTTSRIIERASAPTAVVPLDVGSANASRAGQPTSAGSGNG